MDALTSFDDIVVPEKALEYSASGEENKTWKPWWSVPKGSGYKRRMGKYQINNSAEQGLSDGAYQWFGLKKLALCHKGDNKGDCGIMHVRPDTVQSSRNYPPRRCISVESD